MGDRALCRRSRRRGRRRRPRRRVVAEVAQLGLLHQGSWQGQRGLLPQASPALRHGHQPVVQGDECPVEHPDFGHVLLPHLAPRRAADAGSRRGRYLGADLAGIQAADLRPQRPADDSRAPPSSSPFKAARSGVRSGRPWCPAAQRRHSTTTVAPGDGHQIAAAPGRPELPAGQLCPHWSGTHGGSTSAHHPTGDLRMALVHPAHRAHVAMDPRAPWNQITKAAH